MDRSLLPDILALAVFIVGFYPLARRVGAHANLWFLGWSFLLLHHLATLFRTPAGLRGTIAHLVALWALDLCALTFLHVSANVPLERIRLKLIAAFAVPALVQSALYVLGTKQVWAPPAAGLLFAAPLVSMLLRHRHRNRQLLTICVAYAIFGMAAAPLGIWHPRLVALCALAMLLSSAAYMYYHSLERYSRPAIAAVVGMAGWGVSYPAILVLQHFYPAVHIDRAVWELPQYIVVAGVMLTLLEEHVERTERLAMHDPLTDLPNRRMFEERLIATMEEARINRTTVACLVIDVDNFKTINDTLGHSAGDQLLRALAVRLSWHMSPRDILARTGGDEFTALLAGVNDEHHLRFIASAMMSAGSVPIIIDDNPVDLRISIGIALSPDHADDIDSLRRAADQAMYTAKRRGGSMLAFADED